MTKRQSEALAFIKAFWKENNHSPSYAEIAADLGVALSRSWELVHQLHLRGYVKVMPGRHRSITIEEV